MRKKFLLNRTTFLAIVLPAAMLVSCQKDAAEPSEQTQPENNKSSARISGSWQVETNGKEIGINSTEPGRYSNGDPATLNVFGGDKKNGGGGPRTELESTAGGFTSASDSRTLTVSIKVTRADATTIIGQLFSSGEGDDVAQILVKNGNAVWARGNGNESGKKLRDLPGGFFNFTIRSGGGKVVISSGGQSLTLSGNSARQTNCRFKAGVYLLSTNSRHGASAQIKSISQ